MQETCLICNQIFPYTAEAQKGQIRKGWHLSERKVEDMSKCMVWYNACASDDIHICADCITHAQHSLCRLAHMQHITCSHLK